MDFPAFTQAPEEDSSLHSDQCSYLPAYLRAPEVTSAVMAEYIWITGASGQLRSKTKVLDRKPDTPEEAPVMVVDAALSPETAEEQHELLLKPRKLFKDPFRGGDHLLVLCDAFMCVPQPLSDAAGPPSTVLLPSQSNTRVACESVLSMAVPSEPLLAAEQEYAVIHPAYPTKVPLCPRRVRPTSSSTSRVSRSRTGSRTASHTSSGSGASTKGGATNAKGCNKSNSGGSSSSGTKPVGGRVAKRGGAIPVPSPHAFAIPPQEQKGGYPAAASTPCPAPSAKATRTLADAHLRCCLYAGVKLSGADVAGEGVHSYRVGPSPGVDLGDDLWTSRYLLKRVAEDQGLGVSWDQDAAAPNGNGTVLYGDNATEYDASDDEGGEYGSYQEGPRRPLRCCFSYSTAETRCAPHGLGAVQVQLARLQAAHLHHQVAYNDGKLARLASPQAQTFTHAVGPAGAHVVVPTLTYLQQAGHYVDTRPPADCDPYKVALMLAATTLGVPLPLIAVPTTSPNAMPAAAAGVSGSPPCSAAAATHGDEMYDGRADGLGQAWMQGSPRRDAYDCESDDCADDSCSESESMDTADVLLDELAKIDKKSSSGCDGDSDDEEEGEEDDSASSCGSSEQAKRGKGLQQQQQRQQHCSEDTAPVCVWRAEAQLRSSFGAGI